jgi:hypothetical protein
MHATCIVFTKLYFAHKVYLVVLHMIVRINSSLFPGTALTNWCLYGKRDVFCELGT